MQNMTNTLVIGIGNLFRSDDAVGRHVARQLRGRLPSTVKILECSGETTELLEVWERARAQCVFVIDALCSVNPVGKVQRIDVSRHALPANLTQTSTHAFGLAEAVELARVLGSLPEKVIVFGIEGANFESGQTMSLEVEQAIDRCCDKIGAEVLSSS